MRFASLGVRAVFILCFLKALKKKKEYKTNQLEYKKNLCTYFFSKIIYLTNAYECVFLFIFGTYPKKIMKRLPKKTRLQQVILSLSPPSSFLVLLLLNQKKARHPFL